MDNPNIAFKRKKNKEKMGRPTYVKLRNPARKTKVPVKPRINSAKVIEVRNRTGAGVSECITALKRKSGSVEGAISYIRNKP